MPPTYSPEYILIGFVVVFLGLCIAVRRISAQSRKTQGRGRNIM